MVKKAKINPLLKLVTTDAAIINRDIKQIAAQGKKLNTRIHACMVSITLHAVKHGDVSLLTNLLTALKDNTSPFRVNALKTWAEKEGPFVHVPKDGDKPAHFALNKEKRKAFQMLPDNALKMKLIEVNPFEATKEPEYKGVDIPALIALALKRGDEAAKDEKKAAKSNLKGLELLRSLNEQLRPKTMAEGKAEAKAEAKAAA